MVVSSFIRAAEQETSKKKGLDMMLIDGYYTDFFFLRLII